MVDEIKEKYAVYFPYDGRICIASICQSNIDHVAEAFHIVTDGKEL
jgi:aspartate/tyrosine/aromatic aminotransferase